MYENALLRPNENRKYASRNRETMDGVWLAKPDQSNSDRMMNRAGHNLIVFTFGPAWNSRPVEFDTLLPEAIHNVATSPRIVARCRSIQNSPRPAYRASWAIPARLISSISTRRVAKSRSFTTVLRETGLGISVSTGTKIRSSLLPCCPASVNEPYRSGHCIPIQSPSFERGKKHVKRSQEA